MRGDDKVRHEHIKHSEAAIPASALVHRADELSSNSTSQASHLSPRTRTTDTISARMTPNISMFSPITFAPEHSAQPEPFERNHNSESIQI